MSRFFARSRANTAPAPHLDNSYRSLLNPDYDSEEAADNDARGMDPARRPSLHRRLRSLPHDANAMASRSWLAVAESRPSGERPPPRKLVKDQNGSGRPSFSLELSDSDAEKDKGLVRRQIARLKGLYRRAEKPVAQTCFWEGVPENTHNSLPKQVRTVNQVRMATWALPCRHTASYIALGAIGLSVGLTLRSLAHHRPKTKLIKSPVSTQLPHLSEADLAELPYPSDILPGARDVDTPYGHIRVFEWGPAEGEKVLLMHGISTPCIALGHLAEELVSRGCRVMLFDFFGRGLSDAPVDLPYDIRLYTSQILLVLSSSALPWTGSDGFHLVGYSLGGGVAVSFARYFPHMVRSLVLVAGGGLIRHEHVSWQSKVLYSTGLFPEWVLERLVRRRLTPQRAANEENMAAEAVDTKQLRRQKNSDASGGDSYDKAVLSTRKPGITVAAVMKWQLTHHEGFIPAFVSSIRYAPIYEQREDWQVLGKVLAERREAQGTVPGMRSGRVLMVLGDTDPVIVREELLHDATGLLGEDAIEAVSLDCGHEIVMTRGETVARPVFFKKETGDQESTLSFSREVFAKLSPHPYLLRQLALKDSTAPTRTNGRSPRDARPIQIHTSSLSHAHGSALVRSGDTTVLCGVRAEVLPVTSIPQFRPRPPRFESSDGGGEDKDDADADAAELKEYDLLVPNIELATGCAPQFLPGVPPSTAAQTVSTRVYSLLHRSRLVDVEALRVWFTEEEEGGGGDEMKDEEEEEETRARVMAYWVLYIDVLFVSLDGNAFDAAWTAVVAALRDTKIPVARWDPEREAVVCSGAGETKGLVTRGLPVACTAAVFLEKEQGEPGDGRHWVLLDPDRLEESLCKEVITAVVDCSGGETRIRAIEKVGGTAIGRELVRGFVGVAEARWREVSQAMDS
ncbi:hypothetical protein QBC47DRAFT_358472 [Echria macrotheca]|uniref:Ribosomal RNA-processing protein 43 n=1 Tax=Echria macrotheca TaxID=438768 RepID=A0AAJ0BI44_9PEZI|nr:hypothetical protein QBC47DRAFT_358472 [Echria macrotheca]